MNNTKPELPAEVSQLIEEEANDYVEETRGRKGRVETYIAGATSYAIKAHKSETYSALLKTEIKHLNTVIETLKAQQGGIVRETIEDILFKSGKLYQEECTYLADIILQDCPNAFQVLRERSEKLMRTMQDIVKLADRGIFPHLPVENMGAQMCIEIDKVAREALNAWNGNPKKEGEVVADLGTCKECGTRQATTDYNGHQYYVCNPCSNRLNREFDNEYK
jgi:hypothetical protein